MGTSCARPCPLRPTSQTSGSAASCAGCQALGIGYEFLHWFKRAFGAKCAAGGAGAPSSHTHPLKGIRVTESPTRPRTICTPAPASRAQRVATRWPPATLDPGRRRASGLTMGRGSLLASPDRAPPAHPRVGLARNECTRNTPHRISPLSRGCPRNEKVVGSIPTGGSVCAVQTLIAVTTTHSLPVIAQIMRGLLALRASSWIGQRPLTVTSGLAAGARLPLISGLCRRSTVPVNAPQRHPLARERTATALLFVERVRAREQTKSSHLGTHPR